jgi:hypothetical protein
VVDFGLCLKILILCCVWKKVHKATHKAQDTHNDFGLCLGQSSQGYSQSQKVN